MLTTPRQARLDRKALRGKAAAPPAK